MDRTEYLQLALTVSTLPSGTMEIKVNVPLNMQVKHRGINYYPIGYEMMMKNGVVYHNAILHDLKANSTTYAKLEEVERVEENATESLSAETDR